MTTDIKFDHCYSRKALLFFLLIFALLTHSTATAEKKPLLHSERTFNESSQSDTGYLSITEVIRQLNLDVSWNAESSILALYTKRGKITLMPGNRHIVADEKVITLATAPFFKNGILMVEEGIIDALLPLLSTATHQLEDSLPLPLNETPTVNIQKDRVDRHFKTIVIDAGHGGHDSGAVSPWGIKEKDLVLQIAIEVKKIIEERMGIRVVLTRDGDYFVPLEERTEIAANVTADLFISIHANSTRKKFIRGIETYFMSHDATDEDAMAAAIAENSVIKLEGKTYSENNDLAFILMDMSQTEHLKASSHFAKMLHENLCHMLNTSDRGVKQAPFIVLAGADMPAVLLEVGFLSNKWETKMLQKKGTQNKIAEAIYRSVRRFKESMEIKMSSRLAH